MKETERNSFSTMLDMMVSEYHRGMGKFPTYLYYPVDWDYEEETDDSKRLMLMRAINNYDLDIRPTSVLKGDKIMLSNSDVPE